MRYNYHLVDNGGLNTIWDMEILIPIGTKFLHEFGLYQVSHYEDDKGISTKLTANIEYVICERLKASHEIKNH